MHDGLAAALLVAAAATADLPVFHSEDPGKWGRPSQVVPPEYPADALAKGITGHVDVEGTVGHRLMLDRPALKPGSDDAKVFVAPLEKVLGFWMFQPMLGNDCQPSHEPIRTRVWFEIAEGKPKISVSTRPLERTERMVKFTPVRRDPPAYPSDALRSGVQAIVYMRLVMNAQGDITESSGKAYPPEPGANVLVRAARSSTLGWKFAPEGLEGKGAVLCYQFDFRLRN